METWQIMSVIAVLWLFAIAVITLSGRAIYVGQSGDNARYGIQSSEEQ